LAKRLAGEGLNGSLPTAVAAPVTTPVTSLVAPAPAAEALANLLFDTLPIGG
tara:strand:+ start:337 stop:492 length:156 start_codon:yes stop_codon:yes gene_type:complete